MRANRFDGVMREAILEARKGRFDTFPNPSVGAVLLHDGVIVARGHHARYGGAHAEVDCLRDAQERGVPTRGCTMVVTLEPCNHQGKTPPCSEALVRAGVSRVVIGAKDPNPVAAGGAERLRAAGVDVVEGVLEPDCRMLVADYLTWHQRKRPFVMLKLASTLDGRIAVRTGESRWITGEQSRAEVHRLRSGIGRAHGALLVGGSTFRFDDPELTARGLFAGGPQPKGVVFTRSLPGAEEPFHLLQDRPGDAIFFTPAEEAGSERAEALRDMGVTVLGSEADSSAPVSEHLSSLISQLHGLGMPYVLCEGGGRLGLRLIESGLCDLFFLHMATTIVGDNEARPVFTGRSPLSLKELLGLKIVGVRHCGDDLSMALLPANAWYAESVGEMSTVQGEATLWGSDEDYSTLAPGRRSS